MLRNSRRSAAGAVWLVAIMVLAFGCGDGGDTPPSPGGGGSGGEGTATSGTGGGLPSLSSSSGSGGSGAGSVGECIHDASECAGFCGFVTDCEGGVVGCPECAGENEVCGLHEPNKCGVPQATCTPKKPEEVCAGKCGHVSDGCDGSYECTAENGGQSCTSEQTCVGGACQNNTTCTPKTCADQGFSCGLAGDGCGGTIDCDQEVGCPEGKVCGTGTSAQTCVEPACVPLTPAAACAGTCGVTGDGCGGTIDCEADPATRCPDGQTCGGGGTPGQCGAGGTCTPIPVATACAGKCGEVSDGCGGTYTCTAANGGQTCDASQGESCGGGGVPSQCGKPACTPKTKAEACPGAGGFASCGPVPDGCGGIVACGECPAGQICGLKQAGICGSSECPKTPEATACAGKCGEVPDGCGGKYACSPVNGGVTCEGAEYCGAQKTNECGLPPQTCTPKTCAELGHTCGYASDGCGGQLNCWQTASQECPSPTTQACIADATGKQTCVSGSSCVGSLCDNIPACSSSTPTILKGRVTTPGRTKSNGTIVNQIPVPNVVVYIPSDPASPLPAIFEGVEANNPASCGRCQDEKLVASGQQVLAAAVTDFRGDFTLKGNIPVGEDFHLVLKAGKFRRVVKIAAGTTTACTQKSLSVPVHLPRHRHDGLAGTHLPKVAISTGEFDEMECVLRAIGIDEGEFTASSQSGRIHLYRANGAHIRSLTCSGTYGSGVSCSANQNYGCFTKQSGCSFGRGNSSIESSSGLLLGSQTTLFGYDTLVGDCEGAEHDASDNARILSYVNNGGRMFASHFAYTWIEGNGSLEDSAQWYTGEIQFDSSAVGYVSMPSGSTQRPGANPVKSPIFRNWLDYLGALDGTTKGDPLENPDPPKFTIADPRDRAGLAVGPSTDEWIYRHNLTFNDYPVQQLSFNTPYGASEDAACGRVAYSGFHVANAYNTGNSTFPATCFDHLSTPDEYELSTQEKTLVFQVFDLGACVSDGGPIAPPTCTPKTAADVCPTENSACGFLNDGCGGLVDCGGCTAESYCDGSTCRPKACQPATCASLGYNCGKHPDGCGGIARDAQGSEGCGECDSNQACGLGGPGLCGTQTCSPIPYAEACPPGTCGQVADGCGNLYNCAPCPDGQVCGGGGPNVCGTSTCTPIALDVACQGKNCGFVSNGCGGSHDCGTCVSPDSCGGGGTPNVCGHVACTPETQETACAGLECGWVSDGCGGAIKCGDCANGATCGGAGPNLCGAPCTKTTCEAEGAECGAISDGCNGILVCPPCPSGEVCGAEAPNQCGPGTSCTKTTCAAMNAECGLIGDGCGGVLDCGTCTVAGESCGGAGVANQCDPGTGGCTPTTCEAQGVQCGAASDGCGGLLNCGGCAGGESCEDSVCKPVPK